MTEDVDEAPYVYGFLADLIESNNQHILGANNSNLPRIIAIIAEALATEVLPPEEVAKQRLVSLVKQVQVIIAIKYFLTSPMSNVQIFNFRGTVKCSPNVSTA